MELSVMSKIYCNECDVFKRYAMLNGRNPNNCATWLCNDGTCPHEEEIRKDMKPSKPILVKEETDFVSTPTVEDSWTKKMFDATSQALPDYDILVDNEGVFRVKREEIDADMAMNEGWYLLVANDLDPQTIRTGFPIILNHHVQFLPSRLNRFFFDRHNQLKSQFWSLPRKTWDGHKFV
jgi:hypothetical protein